jgi:prolyl-tRNA editing enzyme YbaK/EbsC (Cys-tRNA(Pro) deacylase)
MKTDSAEARQPKSSIERVAAEAERLGLAIEIRTFDQSTRTAEEAAAACGCDVAQIVKSLVFVDAKTDALVLVLVSGAHALDTSFVDECHGLRLERCDTRRVRNETGFAIGGVAPIGHLAPIRVLMDETLLEHATVWAAAGRPDSVFSVDPKALRDACGAEVVEVRDQP